jgi:hypothetical protein
MCTEIKIKIFKKGEKKKQAAELYSSVIHFMFL